MTNKDLENKVNQHDFAIGLYAILNWSFYFQISLGVIDIILHKPIHYGLPFNSGWILIIGLLTIIGKLQNKK